VDYPLKPSSSPASLLVELQARHKLLLEAIIYYLLCLFSISLDFFLLPTSCDLIIWCWTCLFDALRGCVEMLRRWFSISPTSLMDNIVTSFEDPVYGGFSSLYGRQEHVFTQSWGKCSFCKDINYIHFSVFQSWSQHFV
jgi:hypothetical protein